MIFKGYDMVKVPFISVKMLEDLIRKTEAVDIEAKAPVKVL